MVKPLNKEWALFGRKYRVPGAKGEKVDCHACQKQVSAAVNRLQSHLRVCPARPTPPSATANSTPTPTTGHIAAEDGGKDDDDAPEDDVAATPTTLDVLSPSVDADGTLPAPKRARVFAAAPTQRGHAASWGMTNPTNAQAHAYAARRLEIEEQRLELELARARREQARERLELEILAAQARREALATAAQAYEARVALAVARKQLRDQGIDAHEIDRVLPIEPMAPVSLGDEDATADAAGEEEEERQADTEEEPADAAALETAATTAVGDEDAAATRTDVAVL